MLIDTLRKRVQKDSTIPGCHEEQLEVWSSMAFQTLLDCFIVDYWPWWGLQAAHLSPPGCPLKPG